MNHALHELYRPTTGFIEIDIIFFPGFQSEDYEDAYLKAWMWPHADECWLSTWLPQEYPQARVVSVSYDSSTRNAGSSSAAGQMDMSQIGENLAQSLIGLEGIGQSCSVVLVGHCIGGLVLKEVCLRAEKMAAVCREDPVRCTINPYKTFLGNMKGSFFYSTPNAGSRAFSASKERVTALVQYLHMLSKEAARLNYSFSKLRDQHGWKATAVCEANETGISNIVMRISNQESSLSGQKREHVQVVEEASARFDVDSFCILSGEDNFSICRPRNRASSSFQFLIRFLREIVDTEINRCLPEHLSFCWQRMVRQNWRISIRLPTLFMVMPKRVEPVISFLRLESTEQPSRVALVGTAGIGKTTLAKAVLIQIHTQFDCCCFVENVKGRLMEQHSIQTLVADNLYLGNGRKIRLEDAESLRTYFLRRKVLMIFDDVDSEKQIMDFLDCNNSQGCLGAGSRLIITTRVRSPELISSFDMLEVPFLSQEESETLFLQHFSEHVIGIIPKELIRKVVLECGGLPLALMKTGSYLRFENSVDVWTSALERLMKREPLSGSVEDSLWAS